MYKEFIEIDTYEGVASIGTAVLELLSSRIIYNLDTVGFDDEEPSQTRLLELFDRATGQLLLNVTVDQSADISALMEVGLGLYISHVGSEIYNKKDQGVIIGYVVSRLFRDFRKLMFVAICRDIELARYGFPLFGDRHDYNYFRRPETPIDDYLPLEVKRLQEDMARQILLDWGATEEQVCHITATSDMQTLSELQDIHDMLFVVFNNPTNQRQFMSQCNRNSPFFGLMPLEFLTENPARATEIAQHIRSLGMPW
mgnify:CR=1 FL=1